MSGNITVIGSLNMDLVITTPQVPVMGETILGSDFMTAPGGKGANQAVAAARLGGNVSMIGCVGNDMYGMELMQNLLVNNVRVDHVKVEDATSTGVAIIIIQEGDNCIIVNQAANSLLTPDMINHSEELIKNSNLIVVQLEIPMETVVRALSIAKRHGVKVLLNPAPARKLSDEFLAMVDILTPNETECEIITGITINCIEDAKNAVEFLNQKGVPQVVVTMGGKGVVYNSSKGIQHKPAPVVQVVDTTAAGDSFSGAIALALSQGKYIDEAVDFANIVGPLTVMKKGAQTSLPTIKDVEDYINNK